jgi:hypothetical protein
MGNDCKYLSEDCQKTSKLEILANNFLYNLINFIQVLNINKFSGYKNQTEFCCE